MQIYLKVKNKQTVCITRNFPEPQKYAVYNRERLIMERVRYSELQYGLSMSEC